MRSGVPVAGGVRMPSAAKGAGEVADGEEVFGVRLRAGDGDGGGGDRGEGFGVELAGDGDELGGATLREGRGREDQEGGGKAE